MLDHEEERRVTARHEREVNQYYQRRSFKRTVSQKELPRGDLTIRDVPNPISSLDITGDDVEDDTYILSPRAHSHGKRKGLASASGSGTRNEDVRTESHDEGSNDDDGEEEEESFDVE
jgi:hypothetical protein